jgi:hypothetical protein
VQLEHNATGWQTTKGNVEETAHLALGFGGGRIGVDGHLENTRVSFCGCCRQFSVWKIIDFDAFFEGNLFTFK